MQETNFEQYSEYMRKHQIQELFEDLCAAVTYKQPDDVRSFLINELENRRKTNQILVPNFSEKEIEDIFYLYNLKNDITISRFKTIEAMKSIAYSTFDWEAALKEFEIPEAVDLPTFKNLIKMIIGVSF